jgi:hypothetical protein
MRSRILLLAVTATAALSAAAPAVAADEHGDFQVEWASVTKKANGNGKFHKPHRKAARVLKRSGVMEAVVDEVNARWAVPKEIPVLFSDAIPEGPFYSPEATIGERTFPIVNFPGSFLRMQLDALRPYLRDVKGISPKEGMVAGTAFVLAHELGHALVSQLDLPITGKEEDAVDGFAAYLLTDNPRFGPAAALSAALVFDALSDPDAKLTDADYADEHSLGDQRKYQFLCWIYGADRKTFKAIVGKGGLPRRRAARCGDEWKQVESSWDRLLAPYARDAA